ncbi:hypothetical protein GW17_00031720 [Ensete ventricosum]|nr:hypothetical protein GW17_00031720 [Ensete ventricosum]
MAEALAQRTLLLPGGHLSLPPFCGMRSRPSLAAFTLVSLPKVEPLRSSSCDGKFHGRRLVVGARRGRPSRAHLGSGSKQMALSFKKATKWWQKGLQPNMLEIESAEHLVDSLLNAGDKLVIVDFFSPGCGGCRALHPKVHI